MELLVQVALSGLLLGGVYALLSVGLTLVFGVVRIINFAHGELVMIAMYISWLMFQMYGMDPYVSVIVVVPVLFLVGILIQGIVIQPILTAPPLTKVFATVGLFIALQNLALMIFKADYRAVMTPYSTATLDLAGIGISKPRLVAFVLAVILLGSLYALLQFTMFGKALRAIAENRVVAELMGIRVRWLYKMAFGLGAAVTGVTGALLLPFTYVYPSIGGIYTLVAFVVVVLGGLGNMAGAFLGGLFIGLVEAFSGTYISPSIKEATYFIIFILILLVRPQGLLGRGRGTEEVGLK